MKRQLVISNQGLRTCLSVNTTLGRERLRQKVVKLDKSKHSTTYSALQPIKEQVYLEACGTPIEVVKQYKSQLSSTYIREPQLVPKSNGYQSLKVMRYAAFIAFISISYLIAWILRQNNIYF